MKRIKTAIVLVLCIFSSLLFFACDKTVKVESITLSTESVMLKPNESYELSVTINPKKATNKNIKYVLTNEEIVSLEINENDNTKVKIIANNVDETVTTFLQVLSEDENARSNPCKITIVTDKIKLNSPSKISYDSEKQSLYWDKNESGSGYKLHFQIENEEPKEIICATNSYFVGDLFNKKVTAKVKTLGDDTFYIDSEYCENEIKFLQLSKPEDFSNTGKTIKFKKVKNAQFYNLYVYKNNEKDVYAKYTISDNEFDEEIGYSVNLLDTAGIKYSFEIEADANDDLEYQVYPSLRSERISVMKINTKQVGVDFNFTYSNKTLSWKNIESGGKYLLSRNNGEWTKEFDKNTTSFALDDEDNKLSSGLYSYSIKVLGNNKEFLDSDFSESITIEKLEAPTLRVEDGELKWNDVLNAGGYILSINNNEPFKITSNYYSMTDKSAGQYSFKIASDGNNEFAIASDFGQVFTREKLSAPQNPAILENKYLTLQASQYSQKVKVYLTLNEKSTEIELNNFDENNQARLDISSSEYSDGKYKAHFVCFADNYFTSKESETIQFEKLKNTNTISLNNGELSYSLVENAANAEFYLNGTKIDSLESINVNENETYSINMKFFPELNTNFIISNISSNFEFSKNPAPKKLFIENGEICCDDTNIENKNKIRFVLTKKGDNEEIILNSLNAIKLEEDVVYTLKAYTEGDSLTINSKYTNYITIKLLPRINDFMLAEDTLTFTSINAKSYMLYIQTQNGTETKDLKNETSISFKNLLTEKFEGKEDSLLNHSQIFVCAKGNSLDNVELQDTLVFVNRDYAKNGQIQSNLINFRFLPSAQKLRATQVKDYMGTTDNDKEINELYFECDEKVKLFNLQYTKDGVTKDIVLSQNDYLKLVKKENGIATYIIDSKFLEEGKYQLKLTSFSRESVITNPDNENYTYILNSLKSAELNDIDKLSTPNVECKNNKIIITSNSTSNLYLLKINGEIIYEDILGEGKDLNSLVQNAQSDPSGALGEIAKFKQKERVLPNSYTGSFSVSVISVVAPTNLIEFLGDKRAIRSNDAQSITVTRLSSTQTTLSNGILQWTPVENATGYEIYTYKNQGGKIVENSDPVETISDISTLIFDCYNKYKSDSGCTQIIGVKAITNKDNYLNSLSSKTIEFRILEKPTITIKEGIITWNKIEKTEGYKLVVYKDDKVYSSYLFDNSILKFDATEKSNKDEFESGIYKFELTALGNKNDGDTQTLMSSLKFELDNVTKLEKPLDISLSKGELVLKSINSSQALGVAYYSLIVNKSSNKSEEKIEFNSNSFVYSLPEKYTEGDYIFSYRAMASEGNYLNSNFSNEFSAQRLQKVSKVYVKNGEIEWSKVEKEDYISNYYISINKESKIRDFIADKNIYEMSKDDLIDSGVYSIDIRAIGDDKYISSNINSLFNVAKLDSIDNIRIENGVLVWDVPKTVFGSFRAPNEIYFELEKDSKKTILKMKDTDNSFILDDSYLNGTYALTSYSIGNTESSYAQNSSNLNFVNSKIVTKTDIYKLNSPANLNIEDGINLRWENLEPNAIYKYILYVNQVVDNKETKFKGVVESSNLSLRFDQIRYYLDYDKNKILVLSTDERVLDDKITVDGEILDLLDFEYKGIFKISIANFGDDRYINSMKSNEIEVTLPDPVESIDVTHGKITWTESSQATGYILTLQRRNDDGDDEAFNDYNENIYVTGQTYYNLPDVNYYYDISVRAYSISTDKQTLASVPTTKENYYFNSFKSGNGTQEKPYSITTKEELELVKYNNSAYYKLDSDIVFSGQFTPLFTKDNAFVGTIDGNNKKISNLTITSYYEYSGMLGVIDTRDILDDRLLKTQNEQTGKIEYNRQTTSKNYVGYVFNIEFVDINITSGTFVGAVAGQSNGKVENITVGGNISSTSEISTGMGASTKEVYSGSIVAKNLGTILNCINDASITPSANTTLYSGGISAENLGTISKCTNNGKVSGVYAGGIVAKNITNAIIEMSISTGDIVCYSIVSNSTNVIARAGGISAVNEKNATIENCIVDNKNFGATNGGIKDTTTNNLVVYLGGLVGDNYGICESNLVRIDLHRLNNTTVCGKIIGYNGAEENSVNNNYCLLDNRGIAEEMKGNGNNIANTNKEINSDSPTYDENGKLIESESFEDKLNKLMNLIKG